MLGFGLNKGADKNRSFVEMVPIKRPQQFRYMAVTCGGILTIHGYWKRDQHQNETFQTEIGKKHNVLRVHRDATHNRCSAEIDQFPLLIRIWERTTQSYKHRKPSEVGSFYYTSCETMGTSPFSMLIIRLSSSTMRGISTLLTQTWPTQL